MLKFSTCILIAILFFYSSSQVFGQQEDLTKTYYKNGQIHTLGKYVGDKKVGVWTFYYQNGQIDSSGNFENDLMEGVWNWYYENGQLKGVLANNKGKYIGEAKSYHEN